MHTDETPDTACAARGSSGGGPLRSIADDPARSEAERALAETLIDWIRQRQAMHGRHVETAEGSRLSVAQVKLLFHLPVEGTMRAGRFAAAADLTPAAASQALDALEREGVVQRSRSADDRRAVDVELTELGHRLLDEVREDFHARWNEHVGAIDPDELAITQRVLAQVIETFTPRPPRG